jgi:hypothetical protein
MRSSRTVPPTESVDQNGDLVDRVKVMSAQDATYLCRDYLARRIRVASKEPQEELNSTSRESPPPPPLVSEDIVDAVCREKMCEWSYRVCDHFNTEREIVAIAFSCLDRFIDRCSCDRTAFKLAAMTTLYMATKIVSHRQITISSLSELSRGEFSMTHIAEMEVLILEALGWRVHPPTIQCFVNSLFGLLKVPTGPVSTAIYQRAIFFAEIALYDYRFVARERSLIAIAAIINAMEGMDKSVVSKDEQSNFLFAIHETFEVRFPSDEVETMRNRLWYVYSMSAQYKEDGPTTPHHAIKEVPTKRGVMDGDVAQSPVCVAMTSTASAQ